MPTELEICGAVLAGGLATRMGGLNKALLQYRGEPILQRQLRALSACGVAPIAVVTDRISEFSEFFVTAVAEPVSHRGPLAGIAEALEWAPCSAVLVLACDLPFLQIAWLRRLLRLYREDPGTQIVVGIADGRLQPLCSVFARSLLPEIRVALARGSRSPTRFVRDLDSRFVTIVDETSVREADPDLKSFINWNAPEDRL